MASNFSATRVPESPGEIRHFDSLRSFFDDFSRLPDPREGRSRSYHLMVESIFRFIVPRGARVLEIGSGGGSLIAALEPSRGVGVDISPGMVEVARARHPEIEFR